MTRSCFCQRGGGYAVFPVLLGVATIVGLLLVAQSRNASLSLTLSISETRANINSVGGMLSAHLMSGALSINPKVGIPDPTTGSHAWFLVPAGGLVDLNTASPDLLYLFFSGFGMSQREARQANQRLVAAREVHPVSDIRLLPVILGVPAQQLPGYEVMTTIYSGQRGIHLSSAPDMLLLHLGLSDASPSQKRPGPAEAFISAPMNSNVAVLRLPLDGNLVKAIRNADIAVGSSLADARVLQVYSAN